MNELKSQNNNVELKKMVGNKAASLIKNDMIVGIGTGSTAACMIKSLGQRILDEKLNIIGVPTSYQSRKLCMENGINVIEPSTISKIDLAIDGADEIDPHLNAIKGGGAAQTREKIVASMADIFVLIADKTKLVDALGTGFPVPIEVIPDAINLVQNKLKDLGNPVLRLAKMKDGPIITEYGNFIIDLFVDIPLKNPADVDSYIRAIPGIVETGIFAGMANSAIISYDNEIKTIEF